MPILLPSRTEIALLLERLRHRRPLVHCLTNHVVKNFTANALLALGAAPAMVEHPEEAAEFAGMADALLVNLGTLDESQAIAIPEAVAAAVAAGKPWVLDPVAVGPLGVRTRLALDLLSQRPALIRGNASEIIALAGQGSHGRGVDSGDAAERAIDAARNLARQTRGVVLVTGAVDYITDGTVLGSCANGHILLTRVTGVGCAQGAIAAACAVVGKSMVEAAVAAAVIVGVAGEMAARHSSRPGSFQVEFLDALDAIDSITLETHTKFA